MSRIFISLDETDPAKPTPCVHIHGCEYVMRLTERELHVLIEEAQWILGHMSGSRRERWANLANKYKEIQDA